MALTVTRQNALDQIGRGDAIGIQKQQIFAAGQSRAKVARRRRRDWLRVGTKRASAGQPVAILSDHDHLADGRAAVCPASAWMTWPISGECRLGITTEIMRLVRSLVA